MNLLIIVLAGGLAFCLIMIGVFLWIVIMNISEINQHIYEARFDLKTLKTFQKDFIPSQQAHLKAMGRGLEIAADNEYLHDVCTVAVATGLRAYREIGQTWAWLGFPLFEGAGPHHPMPKKIEGVLESFGGQMGVEITQGVEKEGFEVESKDGGYLIVNPSDEDREFLNELEEKAKAEMFKNLFVVVWSFCGVSK